MPGVWGRLLQPVRHRLRRTPWRILVVGFAVRLRRAGLRVRCGALRLRVVRLLPRAAHPQQNARYHDCGRGADECDRRRPGAIPRPGTHAEHPRGHKETAERVISAWSRVRHARNGACIGVLRRICWSAKKLLDRAAGESLFSGSTKWPTFPQSTNARHCPSVTGLRPAAASEGRADGLASALVERVLCKFKYVFLELL